MTPNPIEEIKQIRHQLGAEAGFDVHQVFQQLREQQAVSHRTYSSKPQAEIADIKTMHPTGMGGRDSS